MNDDQGHDKVHHDACDCGHGEVGQAHVEVNGIVKDEVRGEEEDRREEYMVPGEVLHSQGTVLHHKQHV